MAANNRDGVDAGFRLRLQFGSGRSGATHRGRWMSSSNALKLIFYMFLAGLLVSGCASKPVVVKSSQDLPGLIGKRVMVVGIAAHNCPGAMIFGRDGSNIYIDGVKYWPQGYDRQALEVVGVLAQRHTPDLYLIRHPRWRLLGSAGSIDAAQVRELQGLLDRNGQ